MFAQESVMDIQKEREAFEDCYKTSRDYKFYVKHEMSEKQIFEFKNDKYVVDCVNDGWKIWQAAKAQAVPDMYTPIVLALEDVQSKIAKTSFLTMDEENEKEIMAVDANELAAYINELIEAQEQSHD